MSDDTTGNRARRHAVAKALLHEMERGGGGWNVRNMAAAAIAAVCPPGYVVISRADLEDVVSIADEADVYIDRRLAALDRMWELLRGEEE